MKRNPASSDIAGEIQWAIGSGYTDPGSFIEDMLEEGFSLEDIIDTYKSLKDSGELDLSMARNFERALRLRGWEPIHVERTRENPPGPRWTDRREALHDMWAKNINAINQATSRLNPRQPADDELAQDAWEEMYQEEKAEHPDLPDKTVQTIVDDHMKRMRQNPRHCFGDFYEHDKGEGYCFEQECPDAPACIKYTKTIQGTPKQMEIRERVRKEHEAWRQGLKRNPRPGPYTDEDRKMTRHLLLQSGWPDTLVASLTEQQVDDLLDYGLMAKEMMAVGIEPPLGDVEGTLAIKKSLVYPEEMNPRENPILMTPDQEERLLDAFRRMEREIAGKDDLDLIQKTKEAGGAILGVGPNILVVRRKRRSGY